MKRIKKVIPYISTIFFLTFVIAMFFMVIGQFLIKNILIDRMGIKNWVTDLCVTGWGDCYKKIDVDWEERYPYEEENIATDSVREERAEIEERENAPGRLESKVNAVMEKYTLMQATIEDYTCDFLPFGIALQSLSGGFDRIMGNWLLDPENIYIYSENGGVIVRSPFKSDIETDGEAIASIAEEIVDLNGFLGERNIPFVYVQAPIKENKYDAEYIAKYGANENNLIADSLVEHLKEKQVDCLDLRQSIYEQELDFYDLFFKGDTHWNVYGGLWAANEVSGYLARNYGMLYDGEYYQLENYDVLSREDWYMGCDGFAVTLANLPKEDMELLIPKYETSYRLQIPTLEGIPTEGSFADVMIDYNVLRKSKYYVNAYGAFLYLKPTLLQLENQMEWVPNKGKKVLVLRESFAAMVLPYLSTQYEYVDAITPESFDGSIRAYIEETQPDAVVMLYTGHGTNSYWYDIR